MTDNFSTSATPQPTTVSTHFTYPNNWTDGPTVDSSEELPTEQQYDKVLWNTHELTILGGVLWFVIIITLLGNILVFYAVLKNLRKILEHPFFQPNVFCLYMSLVDILLVVFVGLPAAVAYSSNAVDMLDGMYNMLFVDPIMDYLVWLQLLLIVAICVDRAGHICRPLTYTFSIKATKTAIACLTCTLIPFVMLIVPFITAASASMKNAVKVNNYTGLPGDVKSAFSCLQAINLDSSGQQDVANPLVPIFLGCSLPIAERFYDFADEFKWWENIANSVILLLAVTALAVSNGLIVSKLFKSAQFQKENKKRQEEVARSVRMNSIVTLGQVVLLLISTLPFRYYQISRRLSDTKFNEFFIISVRLLVFFGPMFNPWLYPIRMASIRAFLVTKKRSVVSSVRHFTSNKRYTASRADQMNKYVFIEAENGRNDDEYEYDTSNTKQSVTCTTLG